MLIKYIYMIYIQVIGYKKNFMSITICMYFYQIRFLQISFGINIHNIIINKKKNLILCL